MSVSDVLSCNLAPSLPSAPLFLAFCGREGELGKQLGVEVQTSVRDSEESPDLHKAKGRVGQGGVLKRLAGKQNNVGKSRYRVSSAEDFSEF